MSDKENKFDGYDGEFIDYSAFRDKKKSPQRRVDNLKNVRIPKRDNGNVANYSAAKRELEHRKFVEKKRMIIRRRRIALFVFVLVAVILFAMLILGIVKLFKKDDKIDDADAALAKEIALTDAFLASDSVFYSETENETVISLEKMLKTYTLVNDGSNAVTKSINFPSYYEWDALKYVWLDDKSYIADLKSYLREIGMSQTGYIWSSDESSKYPLTGSYFYDTNSKFISAVCEICLWEASNEFLYSMDTTTKGEFDASEGKTVGEKLEAAMKYILESLYSERDRIIYCADSRSLGTRYGASSNYWYNFRFGNADAYSNIYFYNALSKLSLLYKTDYYYNEEAAMRYEALAKDVYKGFEIFWDNKNERYIGAVDTESEKHDYGFVFLNLEAVYYGLADEIKAAKIYSWLDGTRIIDGDTSIGTDIYHFGYSPRTTTRAADSSWWNAVDNSLREDDNATFGEYYQNGGGSLLLSYYDIMSRFKLYGLENAMPIMKMMLKEYEKDKLIRNSLEPGSISANATNGNFPESGLAPCVYVYGLMGISTDGTVLSVNPSLPAGIGATGIKNLSFGGNEYHILNNDLSTYVFSAQSNAVRLRVGGFPPDSKVLYVCYENNKPIYDKELLSNSRGFVYHEDKIGGNVFAKFTVEAKNNETNEKKQKS